MRIQFQLNYSKWLKSVAIANANATANANMFKVQATEKCNIKSLFLCRQNIWCLFLTELYMYSWADKMSNLNETKANSVVDVWLV